MKPQKIFPLTIIIGVLLMQGYTAKHVQKRGVMDNFNDGLKMAGQMFGINTAADVANLVAKAFSKASNRDKPDFFSIIQKGLQTAASSPDESKRLTNQENDEKEEYEHQQQQGNSEEAPPQFKPFQTKSTTSATDKENAGLNFSTADFVTSMLRMVGFDATKLGALAINALIMIASAIGNTILGSTKPQPNKQRNPLSAERFNADSGPEEEYSPTEHQPRQLKEGTPIDWYLKNPSKKMKGLLHEAMDSKLSDKIITMIENYETVDGQRACLKMLMCKSSPFIWGMQKSLKKRIAGEANDRKSNETEEEEVVKENPFNVESFFTHMPSLDEFRQHGSSCEKLYSNYCNRTDLYRRKRN